MHVIQVGHNNLPTATTFTFFCNAYVFKKNKNVCDLGIYFT